MPPPIKVQKPFLLTRKTTFTEAGTSLHIQRLPCQRGWRALGYGREGCMTVDAAGDGDALKQEHQAVCVARVRVCVGSDATGSALGEGAASEFDWYIAGAAVMPRH